MHFFPELQDCLVFSIHFNTHHQIPVQLQTLKKADTCNLCLVFFECSKELLYDFVFFKYQVLSPGQTLNARQTNFLLGWHANNSNLGLLILVYHPTERETLRKKVDIDKNILLLP